MHLQLWCTNVVPTCFFVSLYRISTQLCYLTYPVHCLDKRKDKRRADFEQGMKRMLIVLSTSFAIFTTTAASLIMLPIAMGDSVKPFAYNLFEIGDMCLVLNGSCSFIFYMISGPMFRNAFWSMVRPQNHQMCRIIQQLLLLHISILRHSPA